MKRENFILILSLLLMAGCEENKQSTDDIITVDVTKIYPEKKLVLQDFMDVEYIPLETTDEFLNQGVVMNIGKEVILVKNRINDGDIFVYDRKTGKALRKINRKGQGREEYSSLGEAILDEDNKEILIIGYAEKNIVYDLFGNFKRRFDFVEIEDAGYYTNIFNYDRDNLIGYYRYFDVENKQSCHIIISKQDGSLTRKIQVPVKKILTTGVRENVDGEIYSSDPGVFTPNPYKGDWILVEPSSDTVYRYLPDGNIHPFIVRVPSAHSMSPAVFLNLGVITDRYYFMRTVKKTFDFAKGVGFPTANFVYDKEEKAVFKYSVFNDDFSNKRKVDMSMPAPNDEIACCSSLEAHQLVDAYQKGELKGKLKEIAATLKEDDNPVIMLVKHKK
jgi:hypothetical protein